MIGNVPVKDTHSPSKASKVSADEVKTMLVLE
jgi:hypothetical protein